MHFQGELWLADLPASKVAADLAVIGDQVVVTSGDRTIGEWKRDDLIATHGPGGYRLVVEGEELIFDTDSEELVIILGRAPEEPMHNVGEATTPPPLIPEVTPTTPFGPPATSPPEGPVMSRPRARRRAPAPISLPEARTQPQPEPPPPPRRPSSTNRLAATSLGFGIAGTVLALVPNLGLLAMGAGILALAFGLSARTYIKRHPTDKGKDTANAGIALGAAAAAMGLIVLVW